MEPQVKVYEMGLSVAKMIFGPFCKYNNVAVNTTPIHECPESYAHKMALERSKRLNIDIVVVGEKAIVHYSKGVATLV